MAGSPEGLHLKVRATLRTGGAALLLACATVCLVLSLLAVVPAPDYLFWEISILVTEFGVGLALAGLSIMVLAARAARTRPDRPAATRRMGRLALVAGLLATVLALSPVARAWPAARAAGNALDLVFPGTVADAPFSLTRLFAGMHSGAATRPETDSYTDGAGGAQGIDIYRPASSGMRGGRAPLVVVIHGGSWRSGDRRQLAGLNGWLADRGYVVASIDYRLAPAHPYPAALQDVGAAIRRLKANAQAYALDTTRIVLLGRSAGAHLALLAAYTMHDPDIRGAVSFYGPTDLRWAWEHPTNPRVIDSRAVLSGFLGGSLESRARLYDEASPVRHVSTSVPTLLIHGGMDELVFDAHARMLADSLRHAGQHFVYVRLPWATHGCDFGFRGPCAQISAWAVERFLSSVLKDAGGATANALLHGARAAQQRIQPFPVEPLPAHQYAQRAPQH